MEFFTETILDFIRVRQLNILVAGVLSLGYLVYQYWGSLVKVQTAAREESALEDRTSMRPSRSRSRSRSRSKSGDSRPIDYRRGRKTNRRGCPNCSQYRV